MEKNIKKTANRDFFIKPILLVLILGALLRILLSSFATVTLDQNTFIAWSVSLAEGSFKNFYSQWSDYLPGYLYVLFILGKIRNLNLIPDVNLYKIPAMVSDVVTAYLIYKIVKKETKEKLGIIASLLYIFNPAILFNSTFWGQVDSLTALFTVLSLYFIESNFVVSAIFLAIGSLIKPQAAIILLVPLFFFFAGRMNFKRLFLYGLIFSGVFTAGFIPFSNGNLFAFIFERVKTTLIQYPYTSVNAFNFWGLFGFWKQDNVLFSSIGPLFTIVIAILFSFKTKFKSTSKYLLASILLLTNFFTFTRMHERHLLPFLAPLLIALNESSVGLIIYFGFSITYVLNLIYVYNYLSYSYFFAIPPLVVSLIIIVNIFLFITFLLWSFDKVDFLEKIIAKLRLPKAKESNLAFEGKVDKKKVKTIFFVVIALSLISRTLFLNKPPSEYFDEVYHAFTAKLILHGDPKAWEWWNPNPEGFAYEWTHPPLAKLGMVLGMKLFGENSFGYRIPGAILGVGSTILIFFIAKEIFKDELLALISSSVFAMEGLNLVLSRIGMNDSYFLFFSLLAFYLFLKDKNFLSSLALGASFASKWSTLWFVPVLFMSHFVFRKKLKLSYLWYLIIPPLIYLASYTEMFKTGHHFGQFIDVQKQMWWYHTNLRATHAYSSSWWSWAFDLRPVYLYTSDELGSVVSRIYAFGNPAVAWFGLLSVIITLYYAIKLKTKKLGLIVFGYVICFVPWALSPRIMFYYHYLPATPFLAIATGVVLRANRKLIIPALAVFLVFFLYFYPHWAGLQIPLWLDKSYYWIPSWR